MMNVGVITLMKNELSPLGNFLSVQKTVFFSAFITLATRLQSSREQIEVSQVQSRVPSNSYNRCVVKTLQLSRASSEPLPEIVTTLLPVWVPLHLQASGPRRIRPRAFVSKHLSALRYKHVSQIYTQTY